MHARRAWSADDGSERGTAASERVALSPCRTMLCTLLCNLFRLPENIAGNIEPADLKSSSPLAGLLYAHIFATHWCAGVRAPPVASAISFPRRPRTSVAKICAYRSPTRGKGGLTVRSSTKMQTPTDLWVILRCGREGEKPGIAARLCHRDALPIPHPTPACS